MSNKAVETNVDQPTRIYRHSIEWLCVTDNSQKFSWKSNNNLKVLQGYENNRT